MSMQSKDSPMWRALTENMRDGLVVVDREGLIQFVNRAACEMLGRTQEELAGKDLGYPITNGEDVTANLLALDGKILTVRLRSAEIQWDDAPAWLVGLHDVTELHAKQWEIERLNQKLARQVEDLEKFAYMLAHDLRAPVRTVCNFAKMLEEDFGDSIPEPAIKIIQQIEKRCDGMEGLIESVLVFARSSVQPFKMEPVNLNGMIADIVRGMEEDSPGVEKLVKVEPLPNVSCDAEMLRQVFCNLISNAIKYSATAEGPEVKVYSRPAGDRHCISVTDNGMGFSQEDAMRVFEPFTRLNPQKRNGVGVGLSIVWNIVTRHGGKVWAEGEKGKGATFHVELPLG